MKEKDIYFHVGLGKAASTFLQYQFFPKLNGIAYLQRSKYARYKKHISNCTEEKILISREMDNQLYYEVDKFLKDYPQAKIIIVFRQHSSWLLSQYKRRVKNGFNGSLKQFIDVKLDKGYWKTEQANYQKMIKFLNSKCSNKPLILDYALLKKEPALFFNQIANYTDSHFDFESLNIKAKHKSYSAKQLILKRKLNNSIFNKDWEFSNSKGINWFFRRLEMLLTYIIFFIAPILPDSFFEDAQLYDPNYLSEIDVYYKNDWAYVCDFFDSTKN